MKTRNRRNRKNHRRRTYKGGVLESNKNTCGILPKEEYQQLYDLVNIKKYSRGFSTYSGGGCDLFIWVKKAKDPHIHVHGFSDDTFSYTITKLDIRDEKVKLPSSDKGGYQHVLNVMCNRLTQKHAPTSEIFKSPKKTLSAVEPSKPSRGKRPGLLGLGADLFRTVSVKLGPIMGREATAPE